jgi:ribose transport system permease protein
MSTSVDTHPADAPGAVRPGQDRLRRVVNAAVAHQSGGLAVALVLLCVFFALTTTQFLSASNLSVVLLQVAPIGLIAIPASMLLLAGYIDLSVGAVAWLCSAVFGLLVIDLGFDPLTAALAALLAGALWGTANGVLTTRFGASPIVVTLAGFSAARGLGDALTDKVTRFGFGSEFGWLGNGRIAGLPVPAAIFIVVLLVGAYLWYQSPVGRHLTAIGADSQAARAVGVAVRRLPFWVYVATGVMAGLSGLVIVAQLDASTVSIGTGLEVQVLTAILLGGVSFQGGRGSLWGVLFGVLFVGVLTNGLVLLNVGAFYVDIAVGSVLFVVALMDVAYQRLEKIPVAAAAAVPATTGKGVVA